MLPAGAALERILEHTGYLALAATTLAEWRRETCCTPSIACVRSSRKVNAGEPRRAPRVGARRDREASSEVESLPLEPGSSDVVRVMNLHKAKGLEAAVVFLADPAAASSRASTSGSSREADSRRGYFEHHDDWRCNAGDAGAAPGWDRRTSGGADVSAWPKQSAALRGRDPRAGPARRGPMGAHGDGWPAWERARAVSCAMRRRAPGSRDVVDRAAAARATSRRAALNRAVASCGTPPTLTRAQPSWSATSVTAEAATSRG